MTEPIQPPDAQDRDALPLDLAQQTRPGPEPEDTPIDRDPDVEEIVDFHDKDISAITSALDANQRMQVTRLLADLTPADTAELLEKIDPAQRQTLLSRHGDEIDPDVFSYLQENVSTAILEQMSSQQVASIVAALDSDDALNLIAPLEEEFRADVIRNLSAKTRVVLEEGLSFPEKSAGRLMQREFVSVPQFWTVGKTLDYMRAAAAELPDSFPDLYVVTPAHHIVGTVHLDTMVKAGRSIKIDSLIVDPTYPVPATMDQEEVALLFKREGLNSAPVIDDDGRMIGVVTVDDVIHVIADEAEEDFLKLAGARDGDFYHTILGTTRTRFYWLFVNLITAVMASYVVSFFEATIAQVVALAILMPIVAGMGGNAGTQTLAVTVRALATRELSSTNMWRAIGRETVIGVLNGGAFAVMIGIFATLWFHSLALGLVIGAAMIINLIVAGFFGAIIPITLHRIGFDPADSATVFLTTFTDVVGFFAFLGLASVFLV